MTVPSPNLFRVLHHVCIVVKDIAASTACYESLGVGPWHNFPPLEIFSEGLNMPNPSGFMQLQYRYCNLDNIQIQLCQPGEEATPQRAFLDTHGEGVFHLGFTVPDLDAAETSAEELGLVPWMQGRMDDQTGGFSYFDTRTRGAGVTLEVRSNKRV